MIKALNAQTHEVDDVSSAVSEVLAQLDMKKGLLRNSIGILMCYPDFVSRGVVKAGCDELPFDVVGATTIDAAVIGGVEPALSLIVLTSDDVFFSSALSRPLQQTTAETVVRDVYLSALSDLPSPDSSGSSPKCALGLTFIAFTRQLGGDEILNLLNEEAGGTPLFGMLTTEYTATMGPSLLFNGESCANRLAVVLL